MGNLNIPNIRVVLVGTSHPGNIGAAARAMKTMGLSQLSLVSPREFPNAQATARAVGADDILHEATIFPTLMDAVADCSLVIGSSARARHLAWPELNAYEAGILALNKAASHSPVAFVFGNERTGLTNAELDHCHRVVRIPTHPDYSSLNLAAAVQVIAYETRMAFLTRNERPEMIEKPKLSQVPASILEMERFYAHIEQVFAEIDFLDPARPRLLMRRLRRLFNRAQPDTVELNLLRGVLTAIQRLRKNLPPLLSRQS